MKTLKLLLLLFIHFSVLNTTNAQQLEVFITPADLGLDESSSIDYIENIDSQYLGLIVNNDGKNSNYLYDINTKTSVSLNYTDKNGSHFYGQNYYDLYTHNYRDLKHFYKDGDWVYTFVTKDDISGIENLMIGTNIQTKAQKIIFEDWAQMTFRFWIIVDGKGFVWEVENNTANKVYIFDNSSLQTIWGEDTYWPTNYPIASTSPFVYKNRIYFFDNTALYSIETNSLNIDKLINNLNDYSEYTEDHITIPTQFYVFNDEVYFVLNDVGILLELYDQTIFGEVPGASKIWKTDGTKENTILLQSIPNGELSNFYSSNLSLFTIDNQLYRIGSLDDDLNVSIHKINNSSNNLLGSIDIEPLSWFTTGTYASGTNMSLGIAPLLFKENTISKTVYLNDKDWLPVIQANSVPFQNIFRVGFLNIENDKINFSNENLIFNSYEIFGGNEIVLNSIQILQTDQDKIGILLRGDDLDDRSYDIPFKSYLSYYEISDLNQPPNQIFQIESDFSYDLDEEILFSTQINNDIYFTFKDTTQNKSGVVWKLSNNSVSTSIANSKANQNSISTYPNPSQNIIKLISTEKLNGNIHIMSLDGRTITTYKINNYFKDINISKLNAGSYILLFEDGQTQKATHFIKQ
ncbi:MAG: T9SS type A sorting domain-containing protein [Chitinophagales bacterium]|nr:T9SS type A sorting domain-containing protein [Chitinophagales bacterium]